MGPVEHAKAFEQLAEQVRLLNQRVEQLTRKPTTELPYQDGWMPRFVDLLAQEGTKKAAHGKLRAEGLGPSWSGLFSYANRCPRFRAELDDTAKKLANKKRVQPKVDRPTSLRQLRELEADPEPWSGMRRPW